MNTQTKQHRPFKRGDRVTYKNGSKGILTSNKGYTSEERILSECYEKMELLP